MYTRHTQPRATREGFLSPSKKDPEIWFQTQYKVIQNAVLVAISVSLVVGENRLNAKIGQTFPMRPFHCGSATF